MHGGRVEPRTRLENGSGRNGHHGVKDRHSPSRTVVSFLSLEHAGSHARKSCWTKAIPGVHVACQSMEPKVVPMNVPLFKLAPDIYSCLLFVFLLRLLRANATREASHNGMNDMFLLVHHVLGFLSLWSCTCGLGSFTNSMSDAHSNNWIKRRPLSLLLLFL